MTGMLRTLVAVMLVASACGGSDGAGGDVLPADDGRVPVILDYSPTVSDLGALLFLATHPDLALIGVTLPGTGESRCGPGVAHTRGALESLGLGTVPVACGPAEAIGDLRAFPDSWRDRSDDIDLPEAAPNEDRSAPDLLADLVAASPDPVELVAVGPLTNLALALDRHPDIEQHIAGITIMGGAVDVPGNVPPGIPGWESTNEHAEVNFWVDATAADRVLRSGVPVTLVPLDATNFVPANAGFARALQSDPASAASTLLSRVWDQAPEWLGGGYYLWDELAAAVVADPSLVTFETRSLVVDDADDAVAGWSRADDGGTAVRVAVAADAAAFHTEFLRTVLGRAPEQGPTDAYYAALEAVAASQRAVEDAIFAQAAAELGFDESSDEAAWIEVLVAAAPTVVDEAMPGFLSSLLSLDPPTELEDLHAAYVDALVTLLDNRDEFLQALNDAVSSQDFEFDLPYFTEMQAACSALADAAAADGTVVDLQCG